MIEHGPVRKRLNNDSEAAAPYLRVARAMLGELKEEMRRKGLDHLQRSKRVGGAVIRVTSLFGQDTIDILVDDEPPPPEDFVFLGGGFICTPAADTVDDPVTPAEQLLLYSSLESDGAVIKGTMLDGSFPAPGPEHGIIDWRSKEGYVLTWRGPKSRYWGQLCSTVASTQKYLDPSHPSGQSCETSIWDQTPECTSVLPSKADLDGLLNPITMTFEECLFYDTVLYMNGVEISTDAPVNIYGAAIRPTDQKLFIVGWDGTKESVYKRTLLGNDEEYHEKDNPAGWELVTTFNTQTVPANPWFFNESCTKATTMSWSVEHYQISVTHQEETQDVWRDKYHLNRVDMEINERDVVTRVNRGRQSEGSNFLYAVDYAGDDEMKLLIRPGDWLVMVGGDTDDAPVLYAESVQAEQWLYNPIYGPCWPGGGAINGSILCADQSPRVGPGGGTTIVAVEVLYVDLRVKMAVYTRSWGEPVLSTEAYNFGDVVISEHGVETVTSSWSHHITSTPGVSAGGRDVGWTMYGGNVHTVDNAGEMTFGTPTYGFYVKGFGPYVKGAWTWDKFGHTFYSHEYTEYFGTTIYSVGHSHHTDAELNAKFGVSGNVRFHPISAVSYTQKEEVK